MAMPQRVRQPLIALPATILIFMAGVLQWDLVPGTVFFVWLGVSMLLPYLALRRKSTQRVQVCSAVLGSLLAAFMVVGREIHLYTTIERLIDLREFPKALVRIAGMAILCGSILYTLFDAAVKQGKKDNRWILPFPVLWAAIFVCWLPYLIIFYPGCISNDSLAEIISMLGQTPLNNHHPLIHQWTIASFLLIGHVFHSLEMGIMLYHLFQMMVMSAIFAAGLHELGRLGTARWLRIVFFAWYALHTVNAFYSITMWKDVLFGGIALLLTIQLMHLCDQNKQKGMKQWFALAATLFLFCLYRNNGYYAFLFGIPFFIVFNRRSWKPLLAVSLSVFVAVNAYHALIFNVLDAEKSKAGESLSVPLQQVARTMCYYQHSVTEEEREVLGEVFTSVEEMRMVYNPEISDPVKDLFLSDVFNKDPLRYAKVWLQIGIRNPLVYLDAFLYQGHGYWYPNTPYWTVYSNIYPNDLGLKMEETKAASALRNLQERLERHPVVGYLYRPGTYVWMLLIACGLLLCKRRALLLTPMLFLLGLWLTTLLSPVFAEYRYLYGVSVCAPYLLGVAQAAESRS